ncbi:MAG: DUF1194 domain-containing protein [Janthinobacterium lividum]
MRALFLLPLLLSPLAALAAEPVDVMLVLVTDVSRSVDDTEFTLEKDGYGAAFADPRVLAAIKGGPIGQIAVAYVEFAGSYEVRTVVDWHIVHDAASAAAFTGEMKAAQRSYWGRTSISAGIDHAMQMLTEGGFEAQRRVIDVAGDGTNNAGRETSDARDDAVKAGVTINGLAIINEHPVSYTFAHVQPPGGLTAWYSDNVTGGNGSFVVEVRSFQTFGEAMTRKLLNEVADAGPHTKVATR